VGEKRADGSESGPRAAVLSAHGIVRAINWTAYAAAGIGAAHAILRIDERIELAVAPVLIAVPLVMMGLALACPGRVRLNSSEGSSQPDGLNAILWSGLVLVLMLAFDPHTLLGRAYWLWVSPLALAYAALWLHTERERVRPVARSYAIVVAALSLLLMSGAWAAGAVYFVNKHADHSAPSWAQTRVTALRVKGKQKAATWLATVAPWGALREPVELEVPRATYERLRAGAAVEVGVRRGALGVAWVEEVRPEAR
jgi:hypothetical protein